MIAIIYSNYGSPDILEYKEIEKPSPLDKEVLVKVKAAAANAADWHLLRGTPFLARLSSGLFKPKNPILGIDVAGTIEAVGKNVTKFKVGDEVYGDLSGKNGGAFAEYACLLENTIAHKPKNLSFNEAAAIPVSAITALQSIRNCANLKKGQKVLINGASGGVGTFSVQIAKALGGEVTGVCGSSKLELTQKIGADHVIDYNKEDFTQNGQQYDVIIDNVGNRSANEYKRALAPNGICVIVGFTSMKGLLKHSLKGAWISATGNKKIKVMGAAKTDLDDFKFMNELFEAEKIRPIIDKIYPLSDAASAIKYLEEGHAAGKIVISV